MLNLGEKLYNTLPQFYRDEDGKQKPTPYPLKRYLQILGAGYDYLDGKIMDFENILDIDNCPKEFLPYIARLIGIEFPYTMDEATQRKFIKVMPTIYRLKGTPLSFEYLAREIFGASAVVTSYKATYQEGMKPEDWRRVYVRVELDGETLYLDNKEQNFKDFAEFLRPANCILVTDLALFYLDRYNVSSGVHDLAHTDTMLDLLDESISKSKYKDIVVSETFNAGIDEEVLKSSTGCIYIDIPKFLDIETKSRKYDDTHDTIQLSPMHYTETYKINTEPEASSRIIRSRTASTLSTRGRLVTSFRTTDYIPVNSNLSY